MTIAMENMMSVKMSSGGSSASSIEPMPSTAMMMRLAFTPFLPLRSMWNVLRSRSSATMAEATERNALEVERPTAEAPMKNATMRIFASTGLKLTTKFLTM